MALSNDSQLIVLSNTLSYGEFDASVKFKIHMLGNANTNNIIPIKAFLINFILKDE
jgi:hypothetical protein